MNLLYVGKDRQLLALSNLIILTELNLDQYKQVSIPKVFEDFESDYRFDYLCSQINSSLHEIVLIDLDWFSKNDYLGARLANHIRLTKWKNISFKEVPIIILRNEPIDITKSDVMKDDLTIFSGKGAYFSTYSNLAFSEYDAFSDEDWFSNIFAITRRHKDDFNYFNYLKSLRFSESYDDSHSITNQWGALRLAANAGYKSSDIGYDSPPKLYFKYLQERYQFELSKTKVEIKAKILLIDDNADKGWENVLKKIFKYNKNEPNSFKVINEKVKEFDALKGCNKKLIEEGDFDLYLVDLRLNGADEDITTDTEKFSGATILKKIKSLNAGNQVIMFTASNKAWNMRALLNGDNAADGYYIKESPQNASDEYFGINNTIAFFKQVNESLKLFFLKHVSRVEMKCLSFIKSNIIERSPDYVDFYGRVEASFKIGFELCKRSAREQKYLNLAYLTYYQVLEDYAGQAENFDFVSNRECYVDNKSIKVIDDSTGSLVWQLTFVHDNAQGNYFKNSPKHLSTEVAVMSLAKISFLLSHKFRKGNAFLKKWGQLNSIRNEKAGHGGRNGYVTTGELIDLLQIVELFLTRP